MQKLSVLMFSKDDIASALESIKDMHPVADEVVLVDSSTRANRKKLLRQKVALRLNKLHIIYVPALGYAEPYRMYGLGMCKHEWVLYLDADERANDKLNSDIRKIISDADRSTSGFMINRILHGEQGKVEASSDLQLRLYRKSRCSYAGAIHESPALKGKAEILPNNYWIDHIHSSRAAERAKFVNRYIPIEMLIGRLSYAIVLKRASKKWQGGVLRSYLLLKLSVTGLKHSDELTKFDYKLYALLQLLAFVSVNSGKKILDIGDLLGIYRDNNYKVDKYFELPSAQRRLQFVISKEVYNAGGLIRYLDLSDNKTVSGIGKKYSNSKLSGVKLLEHLVMQRYNGGKR